MPTFNRLGHPTYLRPGMVLELDGPNNTIVVTEESRGQPGWNCMVLYSSSPAYGQGCNIFVFYEDLKKSRIVEVR